MGASLSWLATLPDGLPVGLCGSGAPLVDPNRAGPCVFVVVGARIYIVDVGEGSPRKMALLGVPPARVDAILIMADIPSYHTTPEDT